MQTATRLTLHFDEDWKPDATQIGSLVATADPNPCQNVVAMTARKAKDKTLSNLVDNWGGFESLVADLHRTGSEVRVQRKVRLRAKEGRRYEIDIVLRSRQGLHEIVTIVECKWWNKRVTREAITHLKHVREQVGAQKAVCFTTVGFQSGAEAVARGSDIGLFLVKPMDDAAWGRPGKVFDIIIQIHQAAVSPLGFPSALLMAPSGAKERKTPPTVHLSEDAELPSVNGKSMLNVRALYDELRQKAYERAVEKRHVWEAGGVATGNVAVSFRGVELAGGEHEVQVGKFPAIVSKFDCDVIFEVRQDRVTIHRGRNLDFALVVEDYVNRQRYTGSRRTGAESTEFVKLEPNPAGSEPPVQDGEILCVLVDGFLDYSKLRAVMLSKNSALQLIPAAADAGR